jgi:hypothetical protein
MEDITGRSLDKAPRVYMIGGKGRGLFSVHTLLTLARVQTILSPVSCLLLSCISVQS